jgi:N-acetylneuraminic acid mutarotase
VSGWRAIAEMPTPRANANALLGADGLVYVIGGWTGNALTGAVEVYFPNEDRWARRTPMPTARRFAAAVLAPDGRIYVAGGTTSAGNTNALERYDPRTDAWTTTGLPRLSQARRNAAAVVLGRSLVVSGGASGSEALVSAETAGFSE